MMDQVVCINDDWPNENLAGDLLPKTYPVKNGIYTPTEVIMTWIGIRAFVLAEIPPMPDTGLDYLWGVTHFPFCFQENGHQRFYFASEADR